MNTIRPPSKFWIVTIPTKHSTIGDICFETDIRGFFLQIKGGLEPDDVLLITDNYWNAYWLAEELLLEMAA